MKSTTTRLDESLDPLAIGIAGGMLWRRDGFVMAGVGEALRIPFDRASGGDGLSGARRAQALLAELAGPDDVAAPGSGPVAFAALPFLPDQPGELVVPELVIASSPTAGRWLTIVGDGSLDTDGAVALAQSVVSADHGERRTAATSLTLTSPIAPESWRDEIVTTARDRIRNGDLIKAVLARELILEADAPLDQRAVLARLVAAHPAATIFALEGFLGASPELLVSRAGDVVQAHPLAGTAPRASDPDEDRRGAAGLLASSKDRWEHRITIDWLLDELLPFCSYVDAEPEPSVVSLPNVHHLGTRVDGRLSAPAVSVLELVAALHPTPAVGGSPQAEALALIAELEHAQRGRYGGPTGWVDAAGNGEFVVAIRSAQLSGTTASLFAGVGVVADSDPESELAETRAKFQAMLPALLQL